MHPGLVVFGIAVFAVVGLIAALSNASSIRSPRNGRRRADGSTAPFVGSDSGGYDSGSTSGHGHHSHHGDGGSFGGGGWFGGGGDGGFGSGGSDGGGGGGGGGD
ncbi:hypothetical protein SAMN06264364_11647 [Quadrisphaera granulorum]|uniref:Uncharacterized protein n=1 Tax=Quadrisphaera granulorum TaxID=317664 RepID=A0A316A4T6_9ACTN|nr:hypothetical protein [Quadrisphaera granulorum]PWJ52911.1 hypothetical protein BXY45_11647 [Quadrisphaera granulorum]SZE97293.1 hypothetical protein SAMN06264364_11647 [Quadrisphaera granulorum]